MQQMKIVTHFMTTQLALRQATIYPMILDITG